MDVQIAKKNAGIEAMMEDHELKELVDFADKAFEIDFSGYAPESLKRRFKRFLSKKQYESAYELKYALVNGHVDRTELVNEITVNVTELFRDPPIFRAVLRHVFPYLQSFPKFRVWHAGCSSGQEVYSLAILLKEHGLLEKSLQYGTDINTQVLQEAREGMYPIADLKQYSLNYRDAGGAFSLSDYYTANYGMVKMQESLGKNMVFSSHDLVKNASFNEFQLIVCRNVLIYFDKELKEKVLRLLVNSLAPFAFLVLGDKEGISSPEILDHLEIVSPRERIYRKKGIIEN